MARTTKAQEARKILAEQWRWLRSHGMTLKGYVERYGSKNDADHFGNGGEAIWEADMGALVRHFSWASRANKRAGGKMPRVKVS